MLSKAARKLGLSKKPAPLQRVMLAATPLGIGLATLQAYHTSVVVNDVEYSFSPEGVCLGRGLKSHEHLPKYPSETTIVEVGLARAEANLVRMLQAYFQRGTYDLLRKNCNSFSDCALCYLFDLRLDGQYCQLEKIGHAADKYLGVVQMWSGGTYVPNPSVDNFDKEVVLVAVKDTAKVEIESALQKKGKRSLISIIRCQTQANNRAPRLS